MKTLRVIAVSVLALLAVISPARIAYAQMDSREAIDLQNQIAELRQELQMMQSAQQSGNQAQPNYAPQPQPQPEQPYPSQGAPGQGSETAADLVVRVAALEEQVRTLQGKVDDLNNQLQRQHDDLTKQIGDLAFKLGQGGGAPASGEPNLGSDSVQTPQAPSQPPAAPQRRTPEMALREGNSALARHDYAGAAAAAREVLASGHGPRLVDAQFLLARAEGGQGQFKDSAADYYKAYSRAPKSPTAQVALLGVANSLLGMGDRTDACEALAKLGAEFPKAPEAVRANATATRRRAGCGK
jgi:TolA-binding protein